MNACCKVGKQFPQLNIIPRGINFLTNIIQTVLIKLYPTPRSPSKVEQKVSVVKEIHSICSRGLGSHLMYLSTACSTTMNSGATSKVWLFVFRASKRKRVQKCGCLCSGPLKGKEYKSGVVCVQGL